MMVRVYVRDFKKQGVVKAINVSRIIGTSNYDRFLMGLMRNMDLDRFYVDESEVERANTK